MTMGFWAHNLGQYIVRGFDNTRQHITTIGRFDHLYEAKEFASKHQFSRVYSKGKSRPSWTGRVYDYINREYWYELA